MSMKDAQRRPSRALFAALLAASLAVVTLDHREGPESPVAPVRAAVAEALAPVEEVTAAAVRPLQEIPGLVTSQRELQAELRRLRAENANLRGALATQPLDRGRLAELDALVRTAAETGRSIVAARVVSLGPAQSFSRTVTIDAGRSSGVREDLTVLNNDGLVGRVVRVTRSSATVLLIVDPESVVGARLASSREVGLLRGRGALTRERLDLELVDNSATPAQHEVLVTWGSNPGSPYVPGVPIGTVQSVYSSPRELSKRAVVRAAVDFSSLDVVGVVVPDGTRGDRPVIRAGAEDVTEVD